MIGWKRLNSNSCLLDSNTHAHSAYTHTHAYMQMNKELTPANLVDRIYSVK